MAEEMETSGPARDAAAQKKYDAAMKAMDSGDFKKAHSAFKKFTEEYPDDAEGWFFRAESANYASGMFGAKIKEDEIMADYTKAIELDGSNSQYFQSYGLFCISIGKYDDAEGAYKEAAEADESLAPTLYSEFAIEYYNHVLGTYGEIMDDPKARAKYAKKALDYMLLALDMDAEEAKNLLQ